MPDQTSSQSSSGQMPMRPFGNSGQQISLLGLGGHHLGDAEDEQTAMQIMQEAIDGGVTFFDNCWEYHRGKTEVWMGKAIRSQRDKVFLMTKVCTHGREKMIAMRMLEESLTRLQTDHLDLWQLHGVSFENDPALFIRPNGAAEAMMEAKKQGKVRFLGFTGHKDPGMHLAMLETGFPFDAVQMPLNPFDGNFRSFRLQVLPELQKRGIAPLGMKPLSGRGEAIKAGVLTPEESLRYAMSLPVATIISGADKLDYIRQNLRIAHNFTPMSAQEMKALEDRVKPQSGDGRFELYKVSIRYDNPEARMAHDFPLDMKSVEAQEMLKETQNTGKPYPQPTM